MTQYQEYGFADAKPEHTVAYLQAVIESLLPEQSSGRRLLDVGCGNGYLAGQMIERGWNVVGVDLSEQGISTARREYPKGRFELVAADDNILNALGESPFDVVTSTEVVEHLYAPRKFVTGCMSALRNGGRFICSTPYHGYLKNLLIAATNGLDVHANPLWDGGHIKLWSRRTLGALLAEAGFVNIQFRGAGRLPFLWKSMVMAGDKIMGGASP
jgi:2-polyprenyl-3-methyl-5-hydroxy-6-metoxy-1,4-benzoquinol methylase